MTFIAFSLWERTALALSRAFLIYYNHRANLVRPRIAVNTRLPPSVLRFGQSDSVKMIAHFDVMRSN
jgi:hypothetical protein